jgi:hypothetical protein
MELFAPIHLLIIFFLLFGVLWPFARILERAGFNRAWCLLMFIPLVNWIALWVFAYAKWPALANQAAKTAMPQG